jgi:predicted nucleic acid-binding protein
MKVYLDTCSIQRPLDDQTQIRIRLEAEAVLGVIALVESKQLELLSSEVLVFESQRTTNLSRREFALEIFANASQVVQVDASIQNRAKQLVARRVMALDALHLAAAEAGNADYFCTCDDKLLKKARRLCAATIKVVSPIELLEELP